MKISNKLPLIILIAIMLAAGGYLGWRSTIEDEPADRTDSTVETEDPKDIQDSTPVIEPESEPEPIASQPNGTLDCADCWLAPVDKNHFLPSTYTPSTEATGVSGGGYLVSEAAQAVRDMFEAASVDGVDMGIISSYRSYSYQESLFERYVQEEMAKGLSRAEAEIQANNYSAKPGTSEHQLGTTADIGCPGCAFEESAANLAVWVWLEENAPDFGFALSYPKDGQENTGYIYEPWHWRYIGITNAQSFALQSALTPLASSIVRIIKFLHKPPGQLHPRWERHK